MHERRLVAVVRVVFDRRVRRRRIAGSHAGPSVSSVSLVVTSSSSQRASTLYDTTLSAAEQQAGDDRGDDSEACAKRERHGGGVGQHVTDAANGVNERTGKPRSILLRSELMCTSTTLLMLSKWMSQTCSMISDW